MKNRSEQGFGILVSPAGEDGAKPGANLLPTLLRIASAEGCSLLGYPLPELKEGPKSKPRTVVPYLFPVAEDKGSFWAFFIGDGHVAGEVNPTVLPENKMTVDEVLAWSR